MALTPPTTARRVAATTPRRVGGRSGSWRGLDFGVLTGFTGRTFPGACSAFLKEIPPGADRRAEHREHRQADQYLRQDHILAGHFIGIELNGGDKHEGDRAEEPDHGADPREPGKSHVLVGADPFLTPAMAGRHYRRDFLETGEPGIPLKHLKSRHGFNQPFEDTTQSYQSAIAAWSLESFMTDITATTLHAISERSAAPCYTPRRPARPRWPHV